MKYLLCDQRPKNHLQQIVHKRSPQIFIQEKLASEVIGNSNIILLSLDIEFRAQIKPAGLQLHYGLQMTS